MRRALAIALLALGSSAGCTPFVASAGDHGAFRQVRVAPTFGERVAAAHAYLGAHPDGAYAPRVRAWFQRAEPIYYALSERTDAGLAEYLERLPDGPHAREAERRRAAIAAAAARPDSLLVAASATEARLAASARSRRRTTDAFATWTRHLVQPETYRRPVIEGEEGLVVDFVLALPAPRCRLLDEALGDVERTCEKEVTSAFTLPSRAEEREAAFVVTLDQDAAGRPRHATIAGEELFVRLLEAETIAALDAGDVATRTRATEAAVAIVRSVTAGWAGDVAECEKRPADGEAFRATCAGLDIVVIAREDGTDVVEVTATE